MPGILAGLEGLGAGLGQYAQFAEQQKQRQLQAMLTQAALRQQQQQQQAAGAAWPAMLGGAGAQQQPISPLSPPGGAPGMAGVGPMGMSGGLGGGVPPLPQAAPPQTPEAPSPRVGAGNSEGMLNLIAKDESDGQNIQNQQGSSAFGPWQILASTWTESAPKAGVSLQQYPTARSAPVPVQKQVAEYLLKTQGTQPWAPYNSKLRADLAAGGGGVGGGGQQADPLQQQAQQTAQTAAQGIDPFVHGRMSLQALAQQIEKANPSADPAVKMMALEHAAKLLAPSAQQEFQMFMLQNKQDLQLMMKQMQIDAANNRTQLAINAKPPPADQILETDQGPMALPHGGRKAEPIDIGGAHVVGATVAKPSSGQQGSPESEDFVAKGIANYTLAPLSGFTMRSKWGQDVMAKVQQLNPDYDQTHYNAKARGQVAFSSGRQADTVRSFSVALDHLAVMGDVSTALANGDVQAINRLGNRIQQEFGYAGPVDFNFVKSIVGDEVSKAVIGGVGSQGDRQQLQNGFDLANSPEQLAGVADMAKRLMAGQLAGLRRQAGTAGFTEQQFDAALSPLAKEELQRLQPAQAAPGKGQTPTAGTVIKLDADGNPVP